MVDHRTVNIFDLDDGEHRTGYTRKSWIDRHGNKIHQPCEEIAIIKDHKLIGFRNPDGSIVHIPMRPEDPDIPPPIDIPS